MAYLNEMSGGDKQFVIEMITDCKEKLPAYINELTNAMDKQLIDDVRFFSHKLHSSFHIVGALELATLTGVIEQLAKTHESTDKIVIEVNKVLPIYNQVVLELDEVLKRLNS
jgi:HPt (histidine-containing phosphotransfer) domain-containing protein